MRKSLPVMKESYRAQLDHPTIPFAARARQPLTASDFAKRLESEATGEWMYVFKPAVAGSVPRERSTLAAFRQLR